jgi:phosphoribosyl-AMP cyclohydrolase
MSEALFDAVQWDDRGLVPAIAQDLASNEVLMLAWMNRESLRLTLDTGFAHYWSRSRGQLWKKGETSGHLQRVHELKLDCDADTLLIKVHQVGGIACHTGRVSCFFQAAEHGAWVLTSAPVLRA